MADRSKIAALILAESDTIDKLVGTQILIKGWVKTFRKQSSFSFIEVNDGSSLKNIQCILDKGLTGYSDIVEKLTTGCSVSIEGTVKESPGDKQPIEIQVDKIDIIGSCDATNYPLQKKRHSLEFLRSIAHLRPRTNTHGAVARIRSQLAFAIHQFFQNEGFYYLQSPIITASDCEGAGEMFQVTTLDLEKLPKNEDGSVDYSKDFFDQKAYLTVSGQLNAEIFASGLSDVYTFGPTFRAENSNTGRHLAEFWMVEPEMAFADLDDVVNMSERFLKSVISQVLKTCRPDLELFDQFISKGILKNLELITKSDFERATYTYAIRILEKANQKFEYPVKWGCDLQTEHERYLAEKHFGKPVIITDYPRDIKAFYMRLNEDNRTVAAMDVLVPKVGEIIGGSQREERLDILEQRMKDGELDQEAYWWYLDLRRYGSVPHGGFGLGFERLLQMITGLENIRDVNPFPRAPGQISF